MERNLGGQRSEASEEEETHSWVSHSYGIATASVAAATAAATAAAPTAEGARASRLFLSAPSTPALPTPPFGPSGVVCVGGGDGHTPAETPLLCCGSSGDGVFRGGGGGGGHLGGGGGGTGAGAPLSTDAEDDAASARSSGLTLHYESAFVELVRGQIERFGESYKRWKLEMEEGKCAQEADMQAAQFQATSALQCAESAVSMATMATGDVALSYASSQNSDVRSSYKERVEYYENYSYTHVVSDGERKEDPCSCYNTYTSVKEQHDRLSVPVDQAPPPEPFVNQDNKFLPMDELAPTEWVYVNPYLCNFAPQKTEIDTSFSCYGEQCEQVLESREERKWFQMPVKEIQELHQSFEDGIQQVLPTTEYQVDVQSEVEDYLEWRNGGKAKGNFPNSSEHSMWPQTAYNTEHNLPHGQRQSSSFLDARDESLYLSPVKEESTEEHTTSTDPLAFLKINAQGKEDVIPVRDMGETPADIRSIKKEGEMEIEYTNGGTNFTPESKLRDQIPSLQENREEIDLSVIRENTSSESKSFTSRQREHLNVNTEIKPKNTLPQDILCKYKSENNEETPVSPNKVRRKKHTIYCPKSEMQFFEKDKHVKYHRRTVNENTSHSPPVHTHVNHDKQDIHHHSDLLEMKMMQDKAKVHKSDTGNTSQQSYIQRNLSKEQIDVSFTQRQLYSTIRDSKCHKSKKMEKQSDLTKHARYSSSCSSVQKQTLHKLHPRWYEKPPLGEHTESTSGSRDNNEQEHLHLGRNVTARDTVEKNSGRTLPTGKMEELNKMRRLNMSEKSKCSIRKQNKIPSFSYCNRYKTSSTDAECSHPQNRVRIKKKYSRVFDLKENVNQKYKKEQYQLTKTNSKNSLSVMYLRKNHIGENKVGSSEEYPSSSESGNDGSELMRQNYSTPTSSDPKTEMKACDAELLQGEGASPATQSASLQHNISSIPQSSEHYSTIENESPVCNYQTELQELNIAVLISSNESDNDRIQEENSVICCTEVTQISSVNNSTNQDLDLGNENKNVVQKQNCKTLSEFISRKVLSKEEVEFWCPGAYVKKENSSDVANVSEVSGIPFPGPPFRNANNIYESLEQHQKEAMKFTISASLATAEIQSSQAFQHNELYEYKLISNFELQTPDITNQEPYKVIYIPVTSSQRSLHQDSTKMKGTYLGSENSNSDQSRRVIEENFGSAVDNESLFMEEQNSDEVHSSDKKSANQGEEDNDRVLFIETSQNNINKSRSQNWGPNKKTDSYANYKVFEERSSLVESKYSFKEFPSEENISNKFDFEYNIPISRSRENIAHSSVTEVDSESNNVEDKEENYLATNDTISESNCNSDNSSCSSPNTIISVITIIDHQNNTPPSTEEKLIISDDCGQCYESEDSTNQEGCFLTTENFTDDLEEGKKTSEFLSNTEETLLGDERNKMNPYCVPSIEEEDSIPISSREQYMLNSNTEENNNEIQEELTKHTSHSKNTLRSEIGFSSNPPMNAKPIKLQQDEDEKLKQLSKEENEAVTESAGSVHDTNLHHENKTHEITSKKYNQSPQDNYDSDNDKGKKKSEIIEIESLLQKELPLKKLRSASSDLMAKKDHHCFLPAKLHCKHGPRRKVKSLQEPCKSSSSIMWHSTFLSKSITYEVPTQALGNTNKPRRVSSNAGFEFTLVDSKEDNSARDQNTSHDSLHFKMPLNERKLLPDFPSRTEPLLSHYSNNNSSPTNLFNLHLFNKFSIGDQNVSGNSDDKSAFFRGSVRRQSVTTNTATQTDYAFINIISPISLQEERQYRLQLDPSEDDLNLNQHDNLSNIKNKMKEVLVHIAKHLLKNDIKRLMQAQLSHETSYTENCITLENIPLKKIQELKDVARKFLTKELKDSYLKQYELSPPGDDQEQYVKPERKFLQIAPSKIASLKQFTRHVLMKKLATRIKKPNKELQAHMSKVKHILRHKARKIFRDEISILCHTQKKKIRTKSRGHRGRRTTKQSKFSFEKVENSHKKSKKNIASHKLKSGISKNKEKKKVRKKIRKIKHKLHDQDLKFIVKKKDLRAKHTSRPRRRKGFTSSHEEANNASKYTYSAKSMTRDILLRRNVQQQGSAEHRLSPPIPFQKSRKFCAESLSMSTKGNVDEDMAAPLGKIPSFLYTKIHSLPPYPGGSSDGNYALHQNYVIAYMPHIHTNASIQQRHSKETAPSPSAYDDSEEPGTSTEQSVYFSKGESIFVCYPGEENKIRKRNPLQASSNIICNSINKQDDLPYINQRINEEKQVPSYERGRASKRKQWNIQHERSQKNYQGTWWHLPYREYQDDEYGEIAYTSDFDNSSSSDLSLWESTSSITDDSNENGLGKLLNDQYFGTGSNQGSNTVMSSFNNEVTDSQKYLYSNPSKKKFSEYKKSSVQASPDIVDLQQTPPIFFSKSRNFNFENKIQSFDSCQSNNLTQMDYPTCIPNLNNPLFPSKVKNNLIGNDYIRANNTAVDEDLKTKFITNSICGRCVFDRTPTISQEQVNLSTPYYLPRDFDFSSSGVDWLFRKEHWDKTNKDQLKQRVKKIIKKSKMEERTTCKKKLKQVLSKFDSQQDLNMKVSKYRMGAHGDCMPEHHEERILGTAAARNVVGIYHKTKKKRTTKKVALQSVKCSKNTVAKPKHKPKKFSKIKPFEHTCITQNTTIFQTHKHNIFISLSKVFNTVSLNTICTKFKKKSYILKSAGFRRTIICLVSVVSLPFLMYIGSILSLGLCNTRPCRSDWPLLWPPIWKCPYSSYQHDSVSHSFF